jgi:hypothetical protein
MRPFDSFDADRRRFLQSLGSAGLASLVAPALAAAQAKTPPSGGATLPRAEPKAEAPPAPPKPPEISDDARALAEVLKRRYGQHLTPEQLEAVTREIENRLQGGKTLRAAKLANGDEPDFTFHA